MTYDDVVLVYTTVPGMVAWYKTGDPVAVLIAVVAGIIIGPLMMQFID